MNSSKPFSWKARAKSFKYAFKGIVSLFSSEHNAWIHAAATILVICAGFFFSISPIEWAVVILTIGAVISAEAVNSAVEALADKITLQNDPLIARAKDIAAAAVLILAIAAVAVGIIIFFPYIYALFI